MTTTITAAPFEIAWLKELERRASDRLPPDNREMMVKLREVLPNGFRPSQINYRLLNDKGPSVEGLLVIGDPGGLVPDVERTIGSIRDRLIQYPHLHQVTAGEVSVQLAVSTERAERLLYLMGSLGHFVGGASGSEHGYSAVTLGRDETLADYLAFESLETLLAKREHPSSNAQALPPELPSRELLPTAATIRNSVFIIMSMDPSDDGLADVHNTIRDVCAEFDLRASRIDEIEHQGPITERILEMIRSAEFIIADLTGERPNVYYEVGYAHAIGKRPILFRKHGTRLHFDLVVHNVPEYRNITGLRLVLRRRLEAILGRSAAKLPAA